MLKRIPPSCYPDEESYKSLIAHYRKQFDCMPIEPDRVVVGVIHTVYTEDLEEEGMDRLIMLIAGMMWTIEKNALTDDDPRDLAYNTWLALKDFSTGNYDDLFTPEDLVLVKQDIKTLYDYFDEHPLLKGD